MKCAFFYDTPLGRLGIAEHEEVITDIYFTDEIDKVVADKDIVIRETQLLKEAYRQLEEYFKGERRDFDLPLNPYGTKFQLSVWEALRAIPYGETWSYKQVAEKVGNPKASRAVGMANNRNPIPIIIPCHRVIGANGQLVGYGGGIGIKKFLLNLEQGKLTQ